MGVIIPPYLSKATGDATYLSRFDITRFGAVGDGAIDNTNAINDAIQAAYDAGGGEVWVPRTLVHQTFRVDGQIVVPHDGVTPRAGQPPIRLCGAGNDWTGYLYDPDDLLDEGSTLDLRYSGGAKILTTGLGRLEIDHLSLIDGGSSSVPFVQTINTTLHVHDVTFVGNAAKSEATCDQDAIVLGGSGTTSGNALTSAFSGYGTVIEHNLFHRIRRGVWGRARANSVIVRENTWTWLCGADSTAAAIEFDGTGAETAGNHISHNLIEVPGYVWGVKLVNAVRNICPGNYFWDHDATLTAAFRIEGSSQYNVLDPVMISNDAKALSNPDSNSVIVKCDKTYMDGLILGGGSDKNFVRPFNATGSESARLFAVYRSSSEASNPGSRIWSIRQDGQMDLIGANAAVTIQTGGSSTGYFGAPSDVLSLVRYAAGTIRFNPLANGIVQVSNGVFQLPSYTTAGRPAASLATGAVIYDSDLKAVMVSDGSSWVNPLAPLSLTAPGIWNASPTSTGSTWAAVDQFRGTYVTLVRRTTISKARIRVNAQSGNISCGLYSADGTSRLATSGAVACPAVGLRDLTFTSPVTLDAGTYFVGLSADNTTFSCAVNGAGHVLGGAATASAHPAPASVTVNNDSAGAIPVIGLW